MKEDLLDILMCPACNSSPLHMEMIEDRSFEIDRGAIFCRSCKVFYKIENGIVNFLNDPGERVRREINAMDEDEYVSDRCGNRYRINDETIQRFKDQFLSLPEGDGTGLFKRGGSFQTIKEGSHRFYSSFRGLNLTGNERVLEVGACFSYASFEFARAGCKVVALDISNYLKVARLFAERSYFNRVFSDMHDMPFREDTFDIVFGSAVLHHTKDLKKAFSEIQRVLKPGGRLLLINESARGVFEKVHGVFEKMARKGFGDTSYTLTEWFKGARKGGFKNIRLDFLPVLDDYIARHKNKNEICISKLKPAYFIKRHRKIEAFFHYLLIPFRILFRPKSWRLICCK